MEYHKVRARSKLFVTEAHWKKRIEFAQKYASWTVDDWMKVLWTDESVFRVSDTKGLIVWRLKGSDLAIRGPRGHVNCLSQTVY